MTKDEHDILQEVVNNQKWLLASLLDWKKENATAHDKIMSDVERLHDGYTKVCTTVYGNEGYGGLCEYSEETRKYTRRNFYFIIGIIGLLIAKDILDWTWVMSLFSWLKVSSAYL